MSATAATRFPAARSRTRLSPKLGNRDRRSGAAGERSRRLRASPRPVLSCGRVGADFCQRCQRGRLPDFRGFGMVGSKHSEWSGGYFHGSICVADLRRRPAPDGQRMRAETTADDVIFGPLPTVLHFREFQAACFSAMNRRCGLDGRVGAPARSRLVYVSVISLFRDRRAGPFRGIGISGPGFPLEPIGIHVGNREGGGRHGRPATAKTGDGPFSCNSCAGISSSIAASWRAGPTPGGRK